MTATQVFARFLKEENLYKYFGEIARSTINSGYLIKEFNKENFSSFKEEECAKNFVDIILKAYRTSLSCIFYHIALPVSISNQRMTLSSKFFKFLRNNINGNYFKVMLPDYMRELDGFRCRNGYHKLEFSYKDVEKRKISDGKNICN